MGTGYQAQFRGEKTGCCGLQEIWGLLPSHTNIVVLVLSSHYRGQYETFLILLDLAKSAKKPEKHLSLIPPGIHAPVSVPAAIFNMKRLTLYPSLYITFGKSQAKPNIEQAIN